jgi:hypothetical protein
MTFLHNPPLFAGWYRSSDVSLASHSDISRSDPISSGEIEGSGNTFGDGIVDKPKHC